MLREGLGFRGFLSLVQDGGGSPHGRMSSECTLFQGIWKVLLISTGPRSRYFSGVCWCCVSVPLISIAKVTRPPTSTSAEIRQIAISEGLTEELPAPKGVDAMRMTRWNLRRHLNRNIGDYFFVNCSFLS